MYCTKSDIQLAFGKSNADKWADVDNNGLQTSIDNRYTWSITNACDELDGRLADSPYQFPLNGAGPFPPILIRMAAYLAGVMLYESRGITDIGPEGHPVHHLSWHRKWVYQCVQDIFARRLTLPNAILRPGALQISHAPDFVSLGDPANV